MIKLLYESGPFGDETTNYIVDTDNTYVSDFINEALKEFPEEWGSVCIFHNNPTVDTICVCSYKHGAIERKALDYEAYSKAKIKSISSNGGWSAMNYDIEVEDFDALPKQEKNDFCMTYWGRVF